MRARAVWRRLAMALTFTIGVGACGDGGGEEGAGGVTSVHLTGSIPASATQKRSGRSGLRLGGLGAGGIDRIVAIPHDRGQVSRHDLAAAVMAPIGPDGSFDLVLPVGRADYVLLLEDSTAASRTERVRAYVTLDQIGDTLVTLPVSSATGDIPLGALAEVLDEAVAEVAPQVTEDRFALTTEVLAQRARTDDAFRSVVNAWINYDPATGRYYSLQPTVRWFTRYQDFVTGQADPSRYTYYGYTLAIRTTDPRVDLEKLCAGTQSAVLRPPGEVRLTNGETYSPTRPISTLEEPLAPLGSGFCFGGILGTSAKTESDGEYAVTFTIGGGQIWEPDYLLDILEGFWTLEIDGEEVADFDVSIGSPVDAGGHPTVAMPVPTPRVDAAANLVGIDLAWRFYDEATQGYVPADPTAIGGVFNGTGMELSAVLGKTPVKSMLVVSPEERAVTSGSVPEGVVWHTGTTTTLPPSGNLLGQLTVHWGIGGVAYDVVVFRHCIDYDRDQLTVCDGDADDLASVTSACPVMRPAEAPIDVNGVLHEAVQAGYYDDSLISLFCRFAEGAVPYLRAVHELRDSSGAIVRSATTPLITNMGPFDIVGMGPGDYTLTTTAYDATATARDVVTSHIRVLPFSHRWSVPTVTATLSGQVLEVVFEVEFATPTHYDPELVCEHLLSAATRSQARYEGCEAPLGADSSCRFCGNVCAADQSCVFQGCVDDVNPTCTAGFADCDSNGTTGANGCETDVTTSAANCGACGHACGSGHVCRNATCVASCPANRGDCDSNGSTGPDGCETDLTTTSTSCGVCGRVCPALSSCTDGVCVPSASSCATGLADCDTNPATGAGGCETDLHSSDAHCGACGEACPAGQACRGGACAARCVGGYADCDSSVATSPATSPVLCEYTHISRYRLTWSAGTAPFRVGDRFVTQAGTITWDCSTIPGLANGTYGPVPCPRVLPSLSTRIVPGL